MLNEGRIPMSEGEAAALEQLLTDGKQIVGMTRRDPGESGPVIVTLDDGSEITLEEA